MSNTTDASKNKVEIRIEDDPEKWKKYPNECICGKDEYGRVQQLIGCPIHGIEVYKDIQTLLSSLKKEKEKFPCGHRKADWDNGYGDCAICQTKLFNNELEEELEKEKVRADRAEHDHEVALTLRDAMRERADKAEKCLESERISVNELSLANQELELRLKKLVEAVETVIDWISEVQCDDVGEIIKRLEKAIKNEEVNVDLKDYTPNLLVEQLSERIKELEAKLASIKADESIGKLVVECDCDHDGEFDAGQRHCRKCGEYLF